YEAPGTGKIRLKPVGHAETRKRGAQLYIDDDLGVHSISNASTKPAVSVHLYAGPITACRIYNEISRSFELKKLSYLTEGVWSPKGQFIESRICEPTLI
ncbi:MAG: hypothetical protein EB120_11770, partial [Proteobacteria bacterium]|nr:hypothetical protein [Pseudomonadota bacterium]